jgi:hypothetical protein
MADQGTGITITFSSGFFAEIVNVRIMGISRGAVDTTHSGTSTWKTFKPSDLVDGGELEVEIHTRQTAIGPPITGSAETVTITLPLSAGTTEAEISFSAFITNADLDFTPIDDVTMKTTIRLKISGAITFTNQA